MGAYIWLLGFLFLADIWNFSSKMALEFTAIFDIVIFFV